VPGSHATGLRWDNRVVPSPPTPLDAVATTSTPGTAVLRADLVGTVAFAVTSVAAAAFLRPGVQAPAAAVSGALFVGGCLAFAWGFLAAVERSRTEAVELSSLFFLKDSAPTPVRRTLLGLLAVQVVTAIATAAARPYTSLAFGVLAPVWGLGLITMWAGLHGTFPPKRADGAAPSGMVDEAVTGGDSPPPDVSRGRNRPE
jgi:hypothetical protein